MVAVLTVSLVGSLIQKSIQVGSVVDLMISISTLTMDIYNTNINIV